MFFYRQRWFGHIERRNTDDIVNKTGEILKAGNWRRPKKKDYWEGYEGV